MFSMSFFLQRMTVSSLAVAVVCTTCQWISSAVSSQSNFVPESVQNLEKLNS